MYLAKAEQFAQKSGILALQLKHLASGVLCKSLQLCSTFFRSMSFSNLHACLVDFLQRKKLFWSSPDSMVLVILLNGQRVNVECHTDSTAEEVFQAVTTHTNVMESHFFGLTYLRGRHFRAIASFRFYPFVPLTQRIL